MYKLTFEKRVWIVKQCLKHEETSKIALAQKVSERTVQQIIKTYTEFGWDGLKDHKTGRHEIVLNPKAVDLIIDLRRKFGYGACHIEEILKKQGFSISHRQIEKVLVRNNLQLPNIKKQKPRKWVRYELPNPNDLWYTDWSYDPFTNQQISIYIDDRTRLVTSYGRFKNANTENSIAPLKTGIAEYGKPKTIMTDHGTTYYNNSSLKRRFGDYIRSHKYRSQHSEITARIILHNLKIIFLRLFHQSLLSQKLYKASTNHIYKASLKRSFSVQLNYVLEELCNRFAFINSLF